MNEAEIMAEARLGNTRQFMERLAELGFLPTASQIEAFGKARVFYDEPTEMKFKPYYPTTFGHRLMLELMRYRGEKPEIFISEERMKKARKIRDRILAESEEQP